MEVSSAIGMAAAMVTALGGFEFIKWAVTRKYGKRIDEAEADKSEFGTLREQVVFLQEQLGESTKELRDATRRELELTREVTMLKTERSLKLCERRMCAERQPQSGY